MRKHLPKHQESKSAPNHQYVTPIKTGDSHKQSKNVYVFQNFHQRMRTRNWIKMMIFMNMLHMNMRHIPQIPEFEVHLVGNPIL